MPLRVAVGSHDAVCQEAGEFPRQFGLDMEMEYATGANYGFGPVVLAAFGFWGLVAISFGWMLHH